MNIFETYEDDRNKRLSEFRSKVEAVMSEIIRLSEMIPREKLNQAFKNGIVEISAYDVFDEYELFDTYDEEGYKKRRGKKFEFCYSPDDWNSGQYTVLGRFPYNSKPADEFEEFIKSEYPGIESFRCHTINIQKKTIEIPFIASVESSESRVTSRTLLNSAKKFNYDISPLFSEAKFNTEEVSQYLGVLDVEFDAFDASRIIF